MSLPKLITDIPGEKSRALASELREYESQNVTYVNESWPIFWERAEGSNVWDVDGNCYIDMTSAFGVASLGHSADYIKKGLASQSRLLLHGMGDVHPTPLKSTLCKILSQITFERWGLGRAKTLLANSGFEAVEAALKTAFLKTKKAGVIYFKGGYHGLGYGSLLVNGFDKFKKPFDAQLASIGLELPFPQSVEETQRVVESLESTDASQYGAIIIEPIQGRGGKRVPSAVFLKLLREWCDRNNVVLIFDEIFTGLNRTGKLFCCEWEDVFPDIICLGKSLTGALPLSACVGKKSVMDYWEESAGEALHTSTFLGNPLACAIAINSLQEHQKKTVTEEFMEKGKYLISKLRGLQSPLILEVRGRGLMVGVEFKKTAKGKVLEMVLNLLKKGVIMLSDGESGNVLAFTPPVVISFEQIDYVVEAIQSELNRT